jgi:hypothetical protein
MNEKETIEKIIRCLSEGVLTDEKLHVAMTLINALYWERKTTQNIVIQEIH